MWSIRVLSGPSQGQIYDLKVGKLTVGRASSCQIVLPTVGVSKEHCEIHVYKDKVVVVDLKSSNGTFVNGVKIQNSILKLGDKLGVFDIILDIIPQTEIKIEKPERISKSSKIKPLNLNKADTTYLQTNQHQSLNHNYPQTQSQYIQNSNSIMSTEGSNALASQPALEPLNPLGPLATESHPRLSVVDQINNQSLSEKINNYFDHAFMPVFYKLSVVFPFKQVLLGIIVLFILVVTVCSVIPMTKIIKESNILEASKRARSVARALARINEQALLSGQLNILNVQEALKEDGVSDALIIQSSDGAVVAPPEKVGRENTTPFLIQARKEGRALVQQIDKDQIAATHPIGAYDPLTGETSIKYHAVIYTSIGSVNVDDDRIISLFMQTLIIASTFGLIIFLIFSKMIEYPLLSLNKEVDKALREKTDHTQVSFDFPELQKTVANVNLILNRMWNGLSDAESLKPAQNKEIEYINMIDLISQPAVVINQSKQVIAANSQIEILLNSTKEQFLNKDFNEIPDSALVQMIQSLIQKAENSVFEKHTDVLPFSQFECQIGLQALLNEKGQPEFYFLTFTKVESDS